MGRVRCQSTSQSGEWWAVVIPGEREGKIMDKWEAPADLVLTSLTTRIRHISKTPLLPLYHLPTAWNPSPSSLESLGTQGPHPAPNLGCPTCSPWRLWATLTAPSFLSWKAMTFPRCLNRGAPERKRRRPPRKNMEETE